MRQWLKELRQRSNNLTQEQLAKMVGISRTMITEIENGNANPSVEVAPDKPDSCIVLFEYAGSPPDLHWPGEYPGLQVRVRDKSYPAGKAKIEQIVRVLHGLHEAVLGGTRYLLVKARGSPEVLKRDANNRVELFVNFEIIKESD